MSQSDQTIDAIAQNLGRPASSCTEINETDQDHLDQHQLQQLKENTSGELQQRWQLLPNKDDDTLDQLLQSEENASDLRQQQPDEDRSTSEQFTEYDLEYLREAFRLFDRKDEGFINPQTLFNGMKALGYHPTEAEVQDLISIVDDKGLGKIFFSDFTRTMAKKMTKGTTEKEVQEVFRVFDLDGNGLITAEDFHQLFVKLGRDRTQADFEDMIAASELRGVTGVNLDDMLEILNEESLVRSAEATAHKSPAGEETDIDCNNVMT